MPRVEDKKHHCTLCKKTSKKKSTNQGICSEHQIICHKRKYWFFYIGETCIKCKEEQQRTEQAERKERYEKEQQARDQEGNDFFQDDAKEERKKKQKDKKDKKDKKESGK